MFTIPPPPHLSILTASDLGSLPSSSYRRRRQCWLAAVQGGVLGDQECRHYSGGSELQQGGVIHLLFVHCASPAANKPAGGQRREDREDPVVRGQKGQDQCRGVGRIVDIVSGRCCMDYLGGEGMYFRVKPGKISI